MRQRGIEGYFPLAPRVRFEVDFEVLGEEHEARPRGRAAVGSFTTVHVGGSHGHSARSVPWSPDWVARLSRSSA